MLRRISLGVLVFTVVLGLAGCADEPVRLETQSYSSTYRTRQDLLSVDLLANRLGMRVDSVNPTHITLKNSSNTVMIFTHNGGAYFVNGREIGHVGEVDYVDGTCYLPQSLLDEIRSAIGSTSAYSSSTPRTRRLSGTVVIDPGHGGKDPGAISVKGYYEKTINLSVARKVAAILKQRGLNVVMTRNSDIFIELERRAEIANQHNADLFVSLHADSSLTHTHKGYSVYMARGGSHTSEKAARAIARRLQSVSPNGNGIRRADYRVLVQTRMPAVLVEIGFISNHGEASLIATDSFQNKLADAISAGICDVIPSL